jgi:putative tryptophan/tyrosine transport system substrate-binding protein
MRRREFIAALGGAVVAAKAAGADALNVLASPLLHGERQAIIQGTADSQLPAIYQWPSTVQEGGLLGYGPRFSEFYFQWARQLSKVLRGTKPADLPIEQPTKYELAINLKTAKALGLEIPPMLLARADEVME